MGYFSSSPMPSSKTGDPGLIVQTGHGFERLVMSDQEICEDALSTLPKLQAVASRDTFGRRWKQRRRKNGVDMFELIPGGGDDPDDDLDIAHAMVAKTELRCHLNEVLNVLVNRNSSDYEVSMKALCGKEVKKGQVLFQQRRKFSSRSRETMLETSHRTSTSLAAVPQDGLIGVQVATLRPKMSVKISTKHKRTQKLVFSTCTKQFPSKDRAIHLMKTIPKDAHDMLVSSDDRSSLRRSLDHIAVGIDIQSKHGRYSARNHSTRVLLYAYASTVPPAKFTHTDMDAVRRQPGVHLTNEDLARRRKAVMNPEAHQILDILTKQLRQYEQVIRRRRFGFQSFVYFPTTDEEIEHSTCFICDKKFSLFRRDLFCQICGHSVCKDCSQLYDVEPKIGYVRKNRCCVHCVMLVDTCVFDDEDLLSALGPVVVDADDSAWENDYPMLDSLSDTVSLTSSVRSMETISESLYSSDAGLRSAALEQLALLVKPEIAAKAQPPAKKKQEVLKAVNSHVTENVRNAKPLYSAKTCQVYDRERDYAYEFSPTNHAAPLAPRPEDDKEAKRVQHIQESGVLNADYDRSALDLLAQLAAKHLNCPIGYVSVIDDTTQHVIGAYQYPEEGLVVPRDETLCMHGVYAETPMVLKNPQRDLRFAQLPVVKDLGFKFYAGFPIKAHDGSVVASLCAGDVTPHTNISTKDYATMEVLTKLAAELLVPRSSQSQPSSSMSL